MILNFRQNARRSVKLLWFAGSSVIFLGLLAMLGWFLRIDLLASFLPYYITMKFNTAMCFITSGTAFIMLLGYRTVTVKNIARALCAFVLLLSAISLAQDLFGCDAGIDQFFVKDYDFVKRGLPNPGRMSPSTSFCFILVCAGFFAIDAKKVISRKAGQYLFHTVTLTASISIIGFILRLPYTLKFFFFSSMAFNTAIGFFILSVAASSVNFNLGITKVFSGNRIGNTMARKLFPRMAVILVAIGFASIEFQRHNYISNEFGLVLSTVSFLLIGLFLISNSMAEMNMLDMRRTEAEAETRMLNRNLEEIVHERTLALEESNERFSKIFDANPICIAMTDIDTGFYADINTELLSYLGYTRTEMIGRTAAELNIISTEYREQMIHSLTTVGYIKNEDIVLRAKNGDEKHALISAEILETNEGRFVMSFVYDITSLKMLENSLKESKKGLEVITDKLTNQNKQLLSFAHIISHNLRSPVSNLNLLMHLYKDSVTAEDKDDLWRNFETVIGHLNSTLEDLLETLRIQEDTGKEREQLRFEDVYKPVYEMLIGQVMQDSAIITTDFSKAEFVEYPKMYLESIMLNLVSNAIKYRSPLRRPEIHIETDLVDGETILAVRDNGLGINMHRHQKNLFGLRKTFHRHTEAKGLGLFITKTQIEAMGGEISAHSIVDVGTTFKVIFNKIQ